MKYVVDRTIDDIVVLQSLSDFSMKDVLKSEIGFDVSDGDCLIYEDGFYKLDEEGKLNRIAIIKAKMDYLKNLH